MPWKVYFSCCNFMELFVILLFFVLPFIVLNFLSLSFCVRIVKDSFSKLKNRNYILFIQNILITISSACFYAKSFPIFLFSSIVFFSCVLFVLISSFDTEYNIILLLFEMVSRNFCISNVCLIITDISIFPFKKREIIKAPLYLSNFEGKWAEKTAASESYSFAKQKEKQKWNEKYEKLIVFIA